MLPADDMTAYLSTLPDSAFLQAMRQFFEEKHKVLVLVPGLQPPIPLYLAGGAAVHWWTRARATGDLDIAGGSRLGDDDLRIAYEDEQGQKQLLHLDRNYNPLFGLMHEDYETDAYPIGEALGIDAFFDLRVLSGVHLALSKVARFADNDREDILALTRKGLILPEEFDIKAQEALSVAIGHNKALVQCNIDEASRIIHGQFDQNQQQRASFSGGVRSHKLS